MHIRKYQVEDKEAVLRIFDLNSPEYFDQSERADYKKYLEMEREDYFVVEKGSKVLGAGGINYEDERAILSWDMIHPDHHGKGLGKQLIAHRFKVIEANNAIDSILVRTSQLTYEFYEKQGFELEKVVKDYWADGYDLYRMRKSIK